MDIAIFGTKALYPPDKENTISGHVQVPLKTAELLSKQGHDVSVITTDAPDNYRLPSVIDSDFNVYRVPDIFPERSSSTVDFQRIPALIRELRELISENQFDRVHFFGPEKINYLVFPVLFNQNIDSVAITYVNFDDNEDMMGRLVLGLLSRTVQFHTLSEFTSNQVKKHSHFLFDELEVSVTNPGIIRDFNDSTCSLDSTYRDSVLFWRNASLQNGADICAEAFTELSTQYPDQQFLFAVRHNDEYEDELEHCCSNHSNIDLLRYPYPDEVTIERLLVSARAVVLPFRDLSINPQFAVLESMASGTPLVTTPVGSNEEIISSGENGILANPTVKDNITAIKQILDNREQAKRIGENGRQEVTENWNWDSYSNTLKTASEI